MKDWKVYTISCHLLTESAEYDMIEKNYSL